MYAARAQAWKIMVGIDGLWVFGLWDVILYSYFQRMHISLAILRCTRDAPHYDVGRSIAIVRIFSEIRTQQIIRANFIRESDDGY